MPVTEPEVFTTLELVAAAGITFRQADYWTRLGLLECTTTHRGQGGVRYFGPIEVEVARALGRLRAAIVRENSLEEVAGAIRDGQSRIDLGAGIELDLDELREA